MGFKISLFCTGHCGDPHKDGMKTCICFMAWKLLFEGSFASRQLGAKSDPNGAAVDVLLTPTSDYKVFTALGRAVLSPLGPGDAHGDSPMAMGNSC